MQPGSGGLCPRADEGEVVGWLVEWIKFVLDVFSVTHVFNRFVAMRMTLTKLLLQTRVTTGQWLCQFADHRANKNKEIKFTALLSLISLPYLNLTMQLKWLTFCDVAEHSLLFSPPDFSVFWHRWVCSNLRPSLVQSQ